MTDRLTRIMYVEDDPDIQVVARLALETLGGFTVAICSSGQAAIDQAPVFRPQLFLLDVMMPVMDGPTTLTILRRLPGFAASPAVFMTAKMQPADVANYLALGAVAVIGKPFDPMILSRRVQEIWAGCHD